MINQISLILITGMVAFGAQADTRKANYQDQASREETAGFLSGAVIGAAAGGPPGAIVGGAIGAIVGDGWHARTRADDLQTDLYESQLELALLRDEAKAMEQEYAIARQELDRVRSQQARVLPAYLPAQPALDCCDNTVVSIHFRTGSSAIESHYEEQLESLARLADQMNSSTVEITGYADRNGDADQNLRLSRLRSESVKSFFNHKGIDNSSITTVAYGESRPVSDNQSFETDFFDRRVIVRLRDTSKSLLTQNPDGQ